MSWNNIFEGSIADGAEEALIKTAIKIGKHVGPNQTLFKMADNPVVDAIRNNVGRPLRHGIENASEFVGDHPIPSAIAAAIAAGLGGMALRNKIKKMKAAKKQKSDND